MTTMLFSLATCRGELPLPMFDGPAAQDAPESTISPWPTVDTSKAEIAIPAAKDKADSAPQTPSHDFPGGYDFHRGPACAAFVMGRCRPDKSRQRPGQTMKPCACPLTKEAGLCWHYLPKE